VAHLELAGAGGGPPHLALVLDAGPRAAPQARGAVMRLGRDAREAEDLGLVVSELVGNAVRHGAAGPRAIILLSVLAAGDAFVVTASNTPAPGGDRAAPAGGAGLRALGALGAQVALRHDPGRTVATCRLPRQAHAVGAMH
jgi:anti-sigma regulatory factor (Ser/Thr protein kinase)